MLVVHGLWAYGGLQLWAEDSLLPALAVARGGRPARAPRAHPFAVGPADLADALAALEAPAAGPARKAVSACWHGPAGDDELTLRLPSIGDEPLASPELARPASRMPPDPAGDGRRAAGTRPALAAWRVPVLVFEAAAAARLLEALAGQHLAGQADLVAGGSIGYLAAVTLFAADLAGRGRVLPVLVAEDDGYAARWRPVLSAADAQRARELAAAIPPLCRAADDVPAGIALAGALDALADSAARTRLQGPLLPVRRGRQGSRPAHIELPERTVAALTTPDARVPVQTSEEMAEARVLATALAAWLASAQLPVGPVRTCFRLVEPPEGSAGWRVEFALQSAEDPSLMLPAEDVWAG